MSRLSQRTAALISVSCLCLFAQDQPGRPVFEVASVKPATSLGPMGMRSDRKGGPGTGDPGAYTCQNCPVYWVLSEAYNLQAYEYAGPEWLNNTRFDFAARIPPGTDKETFRAMLQNLLADRFHLVVHREKKEMQVFELTVAKNGPKFQPAGATPQPDKETAPAGLRRDTEGFPILPKGATMAVVPGHARIRSDDRPLSWFTEILSAQLRGPVVDATGLQGNYSFLLSWAWEENGGTAADPAGTPVAGNSDPYRPALIAAIQSQLGLKLTEKKGQVSVLVLDHMDKTPTRN